MFNLEIFFLTAMAAHIMYPALANGNRKFVVIQGDSQARRMNHPQFPFETHIIAKGGMTAERFKDHPMLDEAIALEPDVIVLVLTGNRVLFFFLSSVSPETDNKNDSFL